MINYHCENEFDFLPVRVVYSGGMKSWGYHSTGHGDFGQNIGLRYVHMHMKRNIDFRQRTICQRWLEIWPIMSPYP